MTYDLIIIGGGPAGITAAIYASRNNLKTLLLSDNLGGLLFNKAVCIENYTGFPSISGIELALKFEEHLKAQENVEVIEDKAQEVKKENNLFLVKTISKVFKSKTLIVASGGEPRKLNIKGENEFLGKGVGYCPVCDASFYKGEDLAIIGGGNAGLEAAIFLSCIAKNILLLERGKALLGDIKNQEKIKKLNNIKVYTNAEALEIKGNNFVSSILWKHNKEILKTNLKAVFIQIGYIPKTELLKDLVDLNEKKEIIVNADMETKTKGLYAGGDIINSKVKQIICAAASGAVASLSAFNYLRKNEN